MVFYYMIKLKEPFTKSWDTLEGAGQQAIHFAHIF